MNDTVNYICGIIRKYFWKTFIISFVFSFFYLCPFSSCLFFCLSFVHFFCVFVRPLFHPPFARTVAGLFRAICSSERSAFCIVFKSRLCKQHSWGWEPYRRDEELSALYVSAINRNFPLRESILLFWLAEIPVSISAAGNNLLDRFKNYVSPASVDVFD